MIPCRRNPVTSTFGIGIAIGIETGRPFLKTIPMPNPIPIPTTHSKSNV
ncbi:hypothetical protein D3OALGB2SA_834 [Olavius algarvensis associated proteobacterium Delta 3]|nr:hypothetical protein D3OALGB2SA_834 [Olavius algarvensis associated proteobacterium Delta 3]